MYTHRSPLLHKVQLSNISPGQTIYYMVAGSDTQYSFTYPLNGDSSGVYPMNVGLTVDLGQTAVSQASVDAIIAMDPDFVLLAGDLAYADGWNPLWDDFGVFIEPLASQYPFLTTGGNHEFGGSENWQAYKSRYPTPFKGAGSTNPCYYGKEVGVVHLIALCSYAGFDTDRWVLSSNCKIYISLLLLLLSS